MPSEELLEPYYIVRVVAPCECGQLDYAEHYILRVHATGEILAHVLEYVVVLLWEELKKHRDADGSTAILEKAIWSCQRPLARRDYRADRDELFG